MIQYNNLIINGDKYFTTHHIWSLIKQIPNLNLDDYSFETPEDVNQLIEYLDNTPINIHFQPEEKQYRYKQPTPQILMQCLEQLQVYLRKLPLLQFDFYPTRDLCIYTYGDCFGSYQELQSIFDEAPNQKYYWNNLPQELQDPNSNMLVQNYNTDTHIATIYHYYTL